jgi:hypothetical protein
MRSNETTKRLYIELSVAINKNQGVECEQYADSFCPPDLEDHKTGTKTSKFLRSICVRCPVQKLCGEYAIQSRQTFGFWGGLTPGQIKKIFNERYVSVIRKGRPRLDNPYLSDGDLKRQAKESRGQSNIRPLYL